jgi:hypothetical protein
VHNPCHVPQNPSHPALHLLPQRKSNAEAAEVALRKGIVLKGMPGLDVIVIVPEGDEAAYSGLSALAIAVFFDSVNTP